MDLPPTSVLMEYQVLAQLTDTVSPVTCPRLGI